MSKGDRSDPISPVRINVAAALNVDAQIAAASLSKQARSPPASIPFLRPRHIDREK